MEDAQRGGVLSRGTKHVVLELIFLSIKPRKTTDSEKLKCWGREKREENPVEDITGIKEMLLTPGMGTASNYSEINFFKILPFLVLVDEGSVLPMISEGIGRSLASVASSSFLFNANSLSSPKSALCSSMRFFSSSASLAASAAEGFPRTDTFGRSMKYLFCRAIHCSEEYPDKVSKCSSSFKPMNKCPSISNPGGEISTVKRTPYIGEAPCPHDHHTKSAPGQ